MSKAGQLIHQWWLPCNFWMAQSSCSLLNEHNFKFRQIVCLVLWTYHAHQKYLCDRIMMRSQKRVLKVINMISLLYTKIKDYPYMFGHPDCKKNVFWWYVRKSSKINSFSGELKILISPSTLLLPNFFWCMPCIKTHGWKCMSMLIIWDAFNFQQ